MCILKERNQLPVLHVDNYHLYITAPFTHQNLHLADLCQSPIDFTQEKCVLSNTVTLILWDPMMHYFAQFVREVHIHVCICIKDVCEHFAGMYC